MSNLFQSVPIDPADPTRRTLIPVKGLAKRNIDVTRVQWTPTYQALSYVWGDLLHTREIRVNGQEF